jgi:predicted transcriptional regulator
MAESMGFAKRGAGKSLSVLVDIGEVERREVKVERGGRMYEYSIGKE